MGNSFVLAKGSPIGPHYEHRGTPDSKLTGWNWLGANASGSTKPSDSHMHGIRVQGVYWTGTSVALATGLLLRDYNGQVFYQLSGSLTPVNHFATPITVTGPIQYYDPQGANTLALFGEYT